MADDREVRQGQLLWAHVPFFDLLPFELIPEERSSARDHLRPLFRLDQRRSSQQLQVPRLPVAALPQNPGEAYAVYRAKRRPVLVVGAGGVEVDRALTRGAAKWQSIQTYLVAPYYGAEPSQQRGGWSAELVRRIRHCEYPQYFWDKLPVGGAEQSILRFDQMQPIGRHHEALEYSPHRLSDEGLKILGLWLRWFLLDELEPTSVLQMAREELPKLA